MRGIYRICFSGVFFFFNLRVRLKACWETNAWEKNYSYYHLCATEDLPKKQLFIYSKSDNICLWRSIEKFIEKQKLLGVDATKLMFEDSRHCEHFRLYRNEYVTSCMQFFKSLADTDVHLDNPQPPLRSESISI